LRAWESARFIRCDLRPIKEQLARASRPTGCGATITVRSRAPGSNGASPVCDVPMPKSATILLIRHAEKSGDPLDATLTPAGEARSQAYVAYFRNLARGPSPVAAPTHLIAAADSVHSTRSRLTLEPLAAALGLPLDRSVADHDFQRLADRLLGDSRYDNATILVCWHHGQILALAHALGAPPSTLPAIWPDPVFGWLLQLNFDASGQLHEAHARNQQLMFDDQGASP
jgi:hypothetical protein